MKSNVLFNLKGKQWVSVLFSLIILLFLITRLYQITQNPPSLYWDEASILYNAYSIGLDGKDEWGEVLPVHFRAFGEFKLPVYIYTTVVFTKLFGLNELAVRLPSVLFSLGSLIITFFIIIKITKSKETALLGMFVFSIAPWLFIFSRSGFEVTAGLFFYTLGILLLLMDKYRKLMIIFSAIAFVLSMYSYNAFRVMAMPTFFIALGYVFLSNFGLDYRKLLSCLKKYLFIIMVSLIIFGISLIPVLRLILFDTGFNRFQELSLFPLVRIIDDGGGYEVKIIPPNGGWDYLGKNYLIFITNFINYFSPLYLLLNGDSNLRHQTGRGLIYIVDYIFLIIGVLFAFKKRKLFILPLIILIITVLPAALSNEPNHSLRSLPMLPFLCLFIAIGISVVVKRIKYSLYFIIVAYLILFSNYFIQFINSYPKNASQEWQYGYKQIFANYKDKFANYNNIIISDQYAQPYIFSLVYLKKNPNDFRRDVEYSDVNDWGFSTVKRSDKIYFMKVKDSDLPAGKNLLFATTSDQRLEIFNLKNTLYFLNGEPSFFVFEYEK